MRFTEEKPRNDWKSVHENFCLILILWDFWVKIIVLIIFFCFFNVLRTNLHFEIAYITSIPYRRFLLFKNLKSQFSNYNYFSDKDHCENLRITYCSTMFLFVIKALMNDFLSSLKRDENIKFMGFDLFWHIWQNIYDMLQSLCFNKKGESRYK